MSWCFTDRNHQAIFITPLKIIFVLFVDSSILAVVHRQRHISHILYTVTSFLAKACWTAKRTGHVPALTTCCPRVHVQSRLFCLLVIHRWKGVETRAQGNASHTTCSQFHAWAACLCCHAYELHLPASAPSPSDSPTTDPNHLTHQIAFTSKSTPT